MSNPNLALLPKPETEEHSIQRLTNRVYELEEQLGAKTEFPPSLGLTPSEAALLGILFRREIVTHQAGFVVLYGSDPNGGPAEPRSVIGMLIMILRKKLVRLGMQIQTSSGVGYYLTCESKARLRTILEREKRNHETVSRLAPAH